MKKFLSLMLSGYLIASFVMPSVVWGQQIPRGVSTGFTNVAPTQKRDVKSFGTSGDTGSSLDQTGLSMPSSPNMSSANVGGIPVYYTVHIIGEVMMPGTYKIAPSDRVTDALKYAGGLTMNGSERTIQLRRDGAKTTGVDLFTYKFKGDLNQNPYLMDNDVVFVPVKKGSIEIEGPVNRPGQYELTKTLTLQEGIDMAGGFSAGHSIKEPLRVIRFDDQEQKKIIEIPSDDVAQLKSFKLQKGDVIVVAHVLTGDKRFDYNIKRVPGDNLFYPTVDDNVYVMGAVIKPGALPFEPTFNYKQYVSLTGVTQYSKIKKVKIVKRNGERFLAKDDTIINPGDTIYVPLRYWRPETVTSWLTTVTSLTLSSLLIWDRVDKLSN